MDAANNNCKVILGLCITKIIQMACLKCCYIVEHTTMLYIIFLLYTYNKIMLYNTVIKKQNIIQCCVSSGY